MGLYVLDNVKLYEADEDNLVHLAFGDSVWTGCQVIAHVGPDMGVRVGAGSIRYAGVNRTVAQTDLTVTAADPTNPRIDLVHIPGATGVPAIVAGTAASTPKPPALPASSILVGFVSVAAAAVNIQSANITDRRLIASDGVVGGLDANKPAAGFAGRLYAARDTGILYHDDGATLAALGAPALPNLVLNSDFGRRTILGQALPEIWTDLQAWTAQTGTLGTVAGNVLTPGSTGAWRAKWNGPTDMWRDGRWSALFKATTTGEQRGVEKYIDANNMVRALYDGSNLTVTKLIAGVSTPVATTPFTLVLNHYYWIELSAQGTTYVATMWDAGVAAATKAASTGVAQVLATVADAAVVAGGLAIFENNTTVSTWGGLSALPGNVYVETWLPESWLPTFTGTLGGQAIGYDESADAGPIGKQWAVRVYIPHAARTFTLYQYGAGGGSGTTVSTLQPSTSYVGSTYIKTANKGGSGTLLECTFYDFDINLGNAHALSDFSDSGETVWTRRSNSVGSASTGRVLRATMFVNPSATATGTAYFMLPQVEQGSAATAWRPAPADDAPIFWELQGVPQVSTTSTTIAEMDPVNGAGSFFLPWDANVDVMFTGNHSNSAAGNVNKFGFTIDGVDYGTIWDTLAVLNGLQPVHWQRRAPLAAGKHRIALRWHTSAGTATLNVVSANPVITIVAYRGK